MKMIWNETKIVGFENAKKMNVFGKLFDKNNKEIHNKIFCVDTETGLGFEYSLDDKGYIISDENSESKYNVVELNAPLRFEPFDEQ